MLPNTKKILLWGQYCNIQKINSHLYFTDPQPNLPKHFKIAKHFKLQSKIRMEKEHLSNPDFISSCKNSYCW